eukprot:TRINITY_DN41692_c0_g1_i1.p1 TRINITY_DN41692_c0_g1~~TRINITY_DN41692_c0_g1_i1.p1  ORF type:complete len:302 (+),score=-8.12 TRINITY_DN41692_c0_g1_i1:118-1023(+)
MTIISGKRAIPMSEPQLSDFPAYRSQSIPNFDNLHSSAPSKTTGWPLVSVFPHFSRHLRRQLTVEIPLLLHYKWTLIALIVMQFVHSIFTNWVHYLHTPGPLLFDLGYYNIPPLSEDWTWISEVCFMFNWGLAIIVMTAPLYQQSPYKSVLVARRCFVVCMCAQVLRCATFMVTVLPSPAHHCRMGSAEYDPPTNFWEILTRTNTTKGCADLIFSGHTLMATILSLCVLKYGDHSPISKIRYMVGASLAIQIVMIIAARKHYTVDILVALYTVCLIWHLYEALHCRYFGCTLHGLFDMASL